LKKILKWRKSDFMLPPFSSCCHSNFPIIAFVPYTLRLFFKRCNSIILQASERIPTSELIVNRSTCNAPLKRPKLNTSPSHSHLQNSTNEDSNVFKSPNTHMEPKTYNKDFNENNTYNKFGSYEPLKPYYGLPFDDSTLKMMSNSSKLGRTSCTTGKLKNKKLNLGAPAGPFTPSSGLSADVFASIPAYMKPPDAFRFCDETLMEAQDLSKVREMDTGAEAGDAEAQVPPDLDVIAQSQGNSTRIFFKNE